MFRLYFSIFWNKEAHLHGDHHGEGTFSMKLPLVVLGVCTLVAGLLPFGGWVTSDGKPLETHISIAFSAAPVALALLGIGLASAWYKTASPVPDRVAASLGGLYKSAYRKFYMDEVYLFVTKKILFNLVGRPAAWIDRNIVDGAMNEMASGTAWLSAFIKGWQSGKVQQYALYFFGGVMLLAVLFIYVLR